MASSHLHVVGEASKPCGPMKPPSISADPFKSAKWDEITACRNFSDSDSPTIALLCQWYAIAQRCSDDIDDAGGQVAYQNDAGDLKALPQIATMKQASSEIRQLSKQLGIQADDRCATEQGGGPSMLEEIRGRSQEKRVAASAG